MKLAKARGFLRLAGFALLTSQVLAQSAPATNAPCPITIDFSFAGYGGGGVVLPTPAPTLEVKPTGGDDTALLQSALDQLAALPPGKDGFRGMLLLAPGTFKIQDQLKIQSGGIVLHGSGPAATSLLAAGVDRRTLIEVRPAQEPALGSAINVVRDAAAGTTLLALDSVAGLTAGDRVVITRPCTADWISTLGMDTAPGHYANMRITWMNGSRVLVWDRQILAVARDSSQITLDAPITTALETQFGLGTVAVVTNQAPITQVGVEELTLDSACDPARPLDEDHSWIALALDGVEDAWVRNVTARHFAGSAVRIGPRGRRITVEDCRSEAPVSEVGGWRRNSFFVEGQQVFVHNCYSEFGLADFAVGLCAGGPNVFLDCQTKGSLSASGSLESWASGTLFERVKIDGAALRLPYDMSRVQGAGWTAANSVIWNCEATSREASSPEGTPNFVSSSTQPLYEASLKARGKSLPPEAKLGRAEANNLPLFQFKNSVTNRPAPTHPLQIVGGRYVVDGHILWGGQINEGWWRGQATPLSAPLVSGPELTRWVPGRVGPSLTEDFSTLAARMREQGAPFMTSLPGLWYDRRRDEHSVEAREDANVWAPFSEMPWARSGHGKAWDGLSKFDLSKYNPWYYSRLRQFARVAATNGLVLYHCMYNTHNVLEILPHYVDYPWRSVNNINNTGLPDLPPDESGNRMHLGNHFYSTDNPVLRQLHRNFILHELDELGSEPNVVLSVAFQFVGPLGFQQFFLDTVAEWEKAHGHKVRLALQTTKDITDAILDDPVRSRQIAVVDLRYWQYRPDGELWSPKGGGNRAFRERVRETFPANGDWPPGTSPEQAYCQVREYRDKYPQLALLAWHNEAGPLVSLMAGAAQVLGAPQPNPMDAWVRAELGTGLMNMFPRDHLVSGAEGFAWCLADEKLRRVLLYSTAGQSMKLDLSLPARGYSGTWVNAATGRTQSLVPPARWSKGAVLTKPDETAWLLSLKPER